MMSLKQRRLFKSYYFELRERYLYYKINSWFTSFEEEYPYEDLITRRTIHHRQPNYWLLAIFIILLLGSVFEWSDFFSDKPDKEPIGTLIWFSIVVLFFGMLSYISAGANKLIKTVKDEYIFFLATSPGKKQVDEFISALKKQQKDYMIRKYVNDSNRTPEDRFHSLNWIRDKEIIDNTEFQHLKTELSQSISKVIPPDYLN